MELRDVLQQMMQESMAGAQLTDLCMGTVTKVDPLEIIEDAGMAPLRRQVLYLTESVVEKKIPVVTHTHTIHDTYTGGGSAENALSHIVCQEHGQTLPVEGGYIILNRALAVGDRVLLLRVQNGQKFIVLSRVFQ